MKFGAQQKKCLKQSEDQSCFKYWQLGMGIV